MRKILISMLLLTLVLPIHAAKRHRGTLENPTPVAYLESYLDGPYPGPPPNVSNCRYGTVPRGTVAKAYSASKGWAIGPLRYDQPAWIGPSGQIKKWEQCGNPGGGCVPCAKPPCPPQKKVESPCGPPPCTPPPPPCSIIGEAEGSCPAGMRVDTQYSSTTPREGVTNDKWELPFGVFGVARQTTTVNNSGNPNCPPPPGGLPPDPCPGQVR